MTDKFNKTIGVFLFLLTTFSFGNPVFFKLIEKGEYNQALQFAEINIPPASRTAEIWLKIGYANEKLNLPEKALACYTFAGKLSPNSSEVQLGLASVYNKLGQVEKSLQLSQSLLKIKFSPQAAAEAIRSLLKLGRESEALSLLQQILWVDEKNRFANYTEGTLHYNQGAYAKALPFLKIAWETQKDVDLALKLTKSYTQLQDYAGTIPVLKKAVEIDPSNILPNMELARAYYRVKNYKDALKYFDSFLAKANAGPEDWYMAAFSKEKIGDLEGASSYHRKVVELSGNSTANEALLSQVFVAKSYIKEKQYKYAVAFLTFVFNADKEGKVVPDIAVLLSQAQLNNRDTAAAISTLEQAASTNTKVIDVYSILADLYERKKMNDKAKKIYEKMSSMDSDDPKATLVLGSFYMKEKNFQNALSYFTKSFKGEESAASAEGIALCALELKKYELAVKHAQKAIKKDPENWKARTVLYKIWIVQNQYDDALKPLEWLIQKDPGSIEYWKNLAVCYQYTNDLEKLSLADQKVIALDPKNVESRIRFATYLLSKGDKKTAYTVYMQLIAIIPQNERVWYKTFELARDLGKKEESSHFLERYLTLRPKDALTLREMGDLLYDLKKLDGAASYYKKASEVNPNLKGFYRRYAEIAISKGSDDEVLQVLKGAERVGEADANIYATLGKLYEKKNDYANAIPMYGKSAQLNAQNGAILVTLSACQIKAGRTDDAIVSLEQALLLNPNRPAEHKTLGELYLKQGKRDQAMKAFTKYLAQNSLDWEIAKMVGLNAYFKKDYAQAAKYLSMVGGKEAVDVGHLSILGEVCFYSNDFGKAVKALEELCNRYPPQRKHKEILKMLAEAYERKNDDASAATVYAEYVELEGVNDLEASYKAALFFEQSNPTLSRKFYLANIRLFPKDYRSFFRLGILYGQRDRNLPEALFMLKRASELVDSFPDIWAEMGRISEHLGKVDFAFEAYKRTLKLRPSHLAANQFVGSQYYKRGQVKESILYLEMANNLSDGKDCEILKLLAQGYNQTGRIQSAIDLLVKAKSLKDKDTTIYVGLVTLYDKSGQTANAVEAMNTLYNLNRTKENILKLAQLCAKDNRFKEAQNLVEQIMLQDSKNIKLLFFLAQTQSAQSKFFEAVDTYQKISELEPNNATAYFERAQLYVKMGKTVWAETFFKRALQRNPNLEAAKTALEQLQKTRKQ